MRKYILKLIEDDISGLKNSLPFLNALLETSAFPERVKETIKKREAQILKVEKYRDKYLASINKK